MENDIIYPHIKYVVDESIENTSATLSLFDNDMTPLRELYTNVSDDIVMFLTSGIEAYSSKKFQESLKGFEKLGFISNEKVEMYEKSVCIKKGVAGAMAYAVLGVAPLLFNTASTSISMHNFQRYYISWLAYVNRVDNVRIRSNVVKMFSPKKVKKFDEIFNKYSAEDVKINDLPVLNRRNFVRLNPQNTERMKIFANTFLRCCDLHDDGVCDRAKEFLDTQCKLNDLDIDRIMISTTEQLDFLSDFIVYNTVEAKKYLSTILHSIEKGKEFATYNIENDPYRTIRQKKAQLLIDGVELSSSAVASVVPKFNTAAVYVDMAADMIRKCIDVPSMDSAYQIEVAKKSMKKALIEDEKKSRNN